MVGIINKTIHEENGSNWLLMLHQIKDATGSSKDRDNGIQVVSVFRFTKKRIAYPTILSRVHATA